MTNQARLAKRMENEIARMRWIYRDGAFYATITHRIEGLRIDCAFERRPDRLRLTVNVEGEALDAAEFRGDRSDADALVWASEQISEFTGQYAKAITATIRAEMTAQIQRARLDYAAALCGRRDAEDAPGVTENSRCP